jgi:hypothetical protein
MCAHGTTNGTTADGGAEPTRDGSDEQGILLSQPAQQQLGQAVEVVPQPKGTR